MCSTSGAVKAQAKIVILQVQDEKGNQTEVSVQTVTDSVFITSDR